MVTMFENIRPCPICKDSRDIVLLRNDDSITFDGIRDFHYSFYIKCPFCGRSTNKYNAPEAAIEEWNRRADN